MDNEHFLIDVQAYSQPSSGSQVQDHAREGRKREEAKERERERKRERDVYMTDNTVQSTFRVNINLPCGIQGMQVTPCR